MSYNGELKGYDEWLLKSYDGGTKFCRNCNSQEETLHKTRHGGFCDECFQEFLIQEELYSDEERLEERNKNAES